MPWSKLPVGSEFAWEINGTLPGYFVGYFVCYLSKS